MGDNLKIENIIPEHIEALTMKLKEMGVNIEVNNDNILVSKTENLKATNVKTLVYPGFPTDLQQPIVTLLSLAKGTSIVEETIYENRFNHVEYINKLGANIEIQNRKLKITGVSSLKGNIIDATDLRAGACLLLAALKADGTSIINNADYVLRGYENIIEKLTNIGAKIELI